MDNRVRQQWEKLGASDPYWAVLSDPEKIAGGWNREEFFQTGTDEISALLDKLVNQGVQLNFDVALDYGCGVGRLSRALAERFEKVLGLDISTTMLSEAKSENAACTNIEFVHSNGQNMTEIESGTIDFIYSNIVLQHTPSETQCSIIAEFCRVLRSGGILVFQAPSHQNLKTLGGVSHLLLGNRFLNLVSTMKYGRSRVMEMHTLNRKTVLNLLAKGNMTILDVEEEDSAGSAFVSYCYFAEKL